MLSIVSRPGDTGFIGPRLTTRALFLALDPLQGDVRLAEARAWYEKYRELAIKLKR